MGHSAAGREGVSVVVGTGRNRLVGGAKKRAAETATRLETDSEEEADVESNGYLVGEEESQGASGSSGAEWSGADE